MGLGASRAGDSEHAAPLFAPKMRNDFGIADGPGKMILVVNGELKMGKGKIAAQVPGHVAHACRRRALEKRPTSMRR